MTKCKVCGKEMKVTEEIVTIDGQVLIGDEIVLEGAGEIDQICLFCLIDKIEKAKQKALDICSNRIAQLEAERLEIAKKYEELSGEKHDKALEIPNFLQK